MHLVHLSLLVTALLLFGCKPQRSGHVVARVGDAELTLEEARTHIDTTRAASEYALTEYVSYWVNTELVYQEAVRRGVEQTPQFNRQLQDVRRQLANQELLEQEIYSDSQSVTPEATQGYFTRHAAEFPVREATLKLNLIAIVSRERANAFAAAVAQGAAWKRAVDNLPRDSSGAPEVLVSAGEQYYTAQTLFPPELWKVAAALSVNEVSFPVKAVGGYFVLQCLARLQQGSPAPIDLVRSEVRQRLLIEARRRRYDELLGTLRRKTGVEVLLDSHPTTDSAHVHE
jgi:hypothetical protein